MMKTLLLLAVSSVVTAGALPSLPAKIILSTCVLLAALTVAARRAPAGYQDEDGSPGGHDESGQISPSLGIR